MDQSGNVFSPAVLLLHEGQSAEFTNGDAVMHNVHVVETRSGATLFNVTTPFFSPYEHRFERRGVYDVSCGIHPGMAAVIVVVSTPYAVVAGVDGSFSLPSVPPGSYRLTIWNVDPARRLERVLEVEASQTELVLEAPPQG